MKSGKINTVNSKKTHFIIRFDVYLIVLYNA